MTVPMRRLLSSISGAAAAVALLTAFGPAGEAPGVDAVAARSVESELWLAPLVDPMGGSDLARGVQLIADDRPADAVPFLSRHLGDPMLASHARLHIGRAQLALGRVDEAIASARQVIKTSPGGAVGEAALWLLAESLEKRNAWTEAVPVWQALTGLSASRVSELHLRLALAAEQARDADLAYAAYARIHYDFPASLEAPAAARALARPGVTAPPGASRLELGRAEKLFAARRYAEARQAYEGLRQRASAEERPLVALRLAQSDFHLQRYTAARDGLRAILDGASGGSIEAEYYWLGTLRGLKRDAEYVPAVARFVAAHPTAPLAETALNDLATYHILADDDGRAAEVFTTMYARFPTGVYADRAAWKAGWWAYKHGNYRETVRLFESAALAMRRADYRPSWLYWAARSHEELGEREAASNGYRQTIVFYRNSYYGREASRGLSRVQAGRPTRAVAQTAVSAAAVVPGAPPASAPLVRALLGASLWDDAIAELRKAQVETGTSPLLEATIAYALNRKGELRPGITAMRRAYPQFMAEGGEALPRRILGVIFPVAHWDLLKRYASDRQIDPFLLTALVAQESTFQADVRSSADAWGLMQLLPSTGRRYAVKAGVRGFTTARLTDPDTNVRLGTAYLSDLLKQFGDPAPALAAYNAGEGRVVRWQAERPGAPRDEFVDDIPFPETQNYVKRIVGTTEDYRILYAAAAPGPMRESAR
jgi:soluble lytic murein transglycosylase